MTAARTEASTGLSITDQLRKKSRTRRERLGQLAAGSRGPRRNDVLPSLELCYLDVDDLQLPERAVRAMDPAHVLEVATSISAIGFCDPVLVGTERMVLDGAIRIAAARQLGLQKVPTIVIGHLSAEEQRLVRLTVNRLSEKGRWNLPELKCEFEELIVAGAAIEISGFTLDEIDHITLDEEAQAIEQGPLAPENAAVAIARAGDIFKLGPHRLLCGDATQSSELQRLLDSAPQARMVFTDEPYNVAIAGHVTSGAHREFAMASGEMSTPEFLAFNVAWMEAALPFLCEGGVLATFIDWRGYPVVHSAASQLGMTALNVVVWGKTNAGMGSLYRSQHEFLPLFKKGDAPHINNVELGRRGRWRSNLWTYPGASSLGSDARRGLKEHPTVKPTTMLEDALLDLTARGDLILDPFLGSGSTLIAAERTGRICYGVEIDPLYVDVIIRRFKAVTGGTAILLETGQPFDVLEEARRGGG